MPSRLRTHIYEPELKDYIMIDQDGIVTWTKSQVISSGDKRMTDFVTPNFHSKIAQGEIVNNPMYFEESTMRFGEDQGTYLQILNSDPSKSQTMLQGNNTSRFLDDYSPIIENSVAPLPYGNLEAIAKQKCLAKVDSTPIALAEDLGEIRETIRFLKNPIQSMQRLTNTFVKNKRSLQGIDNKLERLQAVADLWKTYRFAASPLMRSFVDILEQAAHKPPNRPKRRRASGRSKERVDKLDPTVYRATRILMSVVWEYHVIGMRSLDYHASILYEVSNPLVDWKYKLGLRLKDLPTTGWELIPLSFMFDRMLDVRSFFAGIINLIDPNVTILAASHTRKKISEYSYSIVNHEYAGYTIMFPNKDTVVWNDFHFERFIWNPSVSDTIPSFTPGGLVKDLISILDLVAVLVAFIPILNPEDVY